MVEALIALADAARGGRGDAGGVSSSTVARRAAAVVRSPRGRAAGPPASTWREDGGWRSPTAGCASGPRRRVMPARRRRRPAPVARQPARVATPGPARGARGAPDRRRHAPAARDERGFDADRLAWPLVMRARRPGRSHAPAGRAGQSQAVRPDDRRQDRPGRASAPAGAHDRGRGGAVRARAAPGGSWAVPTAATRAVPRVCRFQRPSARRASPANVRRGRLTVSRLAAILPVVRQSHKTVLLWITLIFAFVVIWQFLSGQRAEEHRVLFSTFVQDVDQHPEKFKAGAPITIRKNQESAEFRGQYAHRRELRHHRRRQRQAVRPARQGRRSATRSSRSPRTASGSRCSCTWLPMLVLVVLFLLFMRQLQVGRRQGDELRQVEGEAALREPAAR